MSTTPRIRRDLSAAPLEEEGIQYFDVADPRSGYSMRLYDFEWLLAARLDGQRSLGEISDWARENLGFALSPSDLTAYAERLREYGFIDPEVDTGGPIVEEPGVTVEVEETTEVDADYTPLPPPGPPPLVESRPAVTAAPPPPATPAVEVRAAPAAAAPVVKVEPVVTPSPAPASDGAKTLPPTPAPTLPGKSATPPRPAGPSTATVEPIPEPQPTSHRSLWAVVAVLLVAGGYALYQYVIAPSLESVKVRVVTALPPSDQTKYFDGTAKVQGGSEVAVAFGEAGTVSVVVAVGKAVKEGEILGHLDGVAALEKQLVEVKAREAFYVTKNDAAKIAEKRKLAADLEARLKKLRLIAPAEGKVTQVLVTVGTPALAGKAAVKIADERRLVAFSLVTQEATTQKAGMKVDLAPAKGGGLFPGRVLDVNGSTVRVLLVDESATKLQLGDELRLVKSRGVGKALRLPASVITRSDSGADQVFVIQGEAIRVQPVTVVERVAADVLISSGLAGGEQIVVGANAQLDTLKDGQKITVEP